MCQVCRRSSGWLGDHTVLKCGPGGCSNWELAQAATSGAPPPGLADLAWVSVCVCDLTFTFRRCTIQSLVQSVMCSPHHEPRNIFISSRLGVGCWF